MQHGGGIKGCEMALHIALSESPQIFAAMPQLPHSTKVYIIEVRPIGSKGNLYDSALFLEHA